MEHQERKYVDKIIKKAQHLISKHKDTMTPYQKQCYIRDLIDIQNKIIYENILSKAERSQGNNLAFIITNINYILGAKQ